MTYENIKIVKLPNSDKDYAEFWTDRHNWAEQALPLDREAIRCGYCGLIASMKELPVGGCIERQTLKPLKDI